MSAARTPESGPLLTPEQQIKGLLAANQWQVEQIRRLEKSLRLEQHTNYQLRRRLGELEQRDGEARA